jgi:hypothetical protein
MCPGFISFCFMYFLLMNTSFGSLFFAAALLTDNSLATSVGLSTIEQPVNLVAGSDPARIPLGEVATESNYHYGRGPVITAPRPALHGAMEWKSGTELNQNLASVFGIRVDNHDAPHSPVTIHLKDHAIPTYSPYSKEQVLAATIHCLLRSNGGSPNAPIKIEIVAESPADQEIAAKYAGDYINVPEKHDDPPIKPTPVPGTRLETDTRGVTWVVFPDVKAKPATPARPPVLIPFRLGGEFSPDHATWKLLPVWPGTEHTWEDSLAMLGRPNPLFYDCFNPGDVDGPETNALFAGNPRGSVHGFDVSSSEEGLSADLMFPRTDTETLSALLLSLIVSVQPTADRPLTINLDTEMNTPPSWLADFRKCAGWNATETPVIIGGKEMNRRIVLSCSFVWDPKTATLSQGAVPHAKVVRTSDGALYVEAESAPRED